MAKSFKTLKAESIKYFNEHKKTKIAYQYTVGLLLTLISAFMFAFSFKIFQSPSVEGIEIMPLISGGTGGLSRTVGVIFQMFGYQNYVLVYSVTYALLNVPIVILAFKLIGFRFGLLTGLNVVLTSLISNFIDLSALNDLAKSIACVTGDGLQAGLLTRAILSGVFGGVASSFAYGSGGCSGGVDAIGYYFSMRKSTNIGRYVIAINTFVFILFATLNSVYEYMSGVSMDMVISNFFLVLLFLAIFTFVTALVIDAITRNNKKEQIQIITKEESLVKLLLDNIPHSATIVRAKGAFTGEDKIIIYAIVTVYETKGVVELVRAADPNSFVNITSIKQVIGRFRINKDK